MGKKQHQKDKLYLTATEWATEWGGKKAAGRGVCAKDLKDFRRLPFDHCSLSLQPYEAPYADDEGNVFDLPHIVPYIKKFRANPVTGKKLEASMLTKLKVHKNTEGQQHCPVLFKVFNDNTHIACIRSTGNVYSYEAVEELNIKPKNWKDLLTDEPFQRKDILILQDPQNSEKCNISNFHHIKNSLKVDDDGEKSIRDITNRFHYFFSTIPDFFIKFSVGSVVNAFVSEGSRSITTASVEGSGPIGFCQARFRLGLGVLTEKPKFLRFFFKKYKVLLFWNRGNRGVNEV